MRQLAARAADWVDLPIAAKLGKVVREQLIAAPNVP